MSNLQLIEELCAISERLIGLVRLLSSELEQARCLTDAEREAVQEVNKSLSAITGANDP